MRRHPPLPRLLGAMAVWVLLAAHVRADPPRNLDFEQADKQGVPGWFVPPVCASAGWSASTSEEAPAEGKRCVVLSRARGKVGDVQSASFGNFMQMFDAEPFRNKRITVTARARLGAPEDPAHPPGRIQVWVRVDRADQRTGFFDNCADRPITAQEWQSVRIAGDVAEDAAGICVGMMVMGGDGPAYLDDVSIVASEKPATRVDPPAPLSERGLANLEALTRVVGYIRHYCPSDEAASLDWDRFTVDAIPAAEAAASAEELAAVLRTTFAPIAPAATFSAMPIEGPFEAKGMLCPDGHATGSTRWRHRGFGIGAKKQGAIYVSERVQAAAGDKAPQGTPEVGEAITRRLALSAEPNGAAVWVRVPIALYTDAQGTLPHPVSSYVVSPDAPDLTADARAVRIAGVMLAWNILQHHFPYFDVIHDDWNGALREALRSAATDADSGAFQLTLERLAAHLHDGHGHVGSREVGPVYTLPLLLGFVGDRPVVLNAIGDATPKGVRPGDVLLSVAGTPVSALINEARAHEPAATEGNFEFRAARRIARRGTADVVGVGLRSPDGRERTISLKPVPLDRLPPERSGPIISEPKPGVWYIDLDRASDKDIAAALPSLARAGGIVFDMRGYPNNFSMGLLGHLSDTPVLCAKWEIPIANWPDRERLEFDHARWDLRPLKPRLTAKVAFITDGRAISAAETFLGIVEAYKLAEIVGEPTAGTNGNVNVIQLPGGFSISFTGMKVLKHDGSQHHGIGILPTVAAHRTIEGIAAARDEMLEKAIQIVTPADPPK